MDNGKLYLLPAPLSDSNPDKVFPVYNIQVIRSLNYFIVEEIRTARRFLKKIIPDIDISRLHFVLFNEHTDRAEIHTCIDPLLGGHNVGLLSEAGVPCVADPGSEIVRMAHEFNIEVIPLTGPSSLLLALMASGFNGQNFAFQGYLPVDKRMRVKKIREMELRILSEDQTQIFIETPYRNQQVFQAIVETCRKDLLLCIATDITADVQSIKVKTIDEWKKRLPDIKKRPTVFLLFK